MDVVLFLISLLGVCVAVCNACSCFPDAGPDRFCHYDVIFRGTALTEYEEREEPLDHSDPFSKYSPFKDWVYTVRVDKPIVMPSNMTSIKKIELRTPTQGSMCGTRFPLDVDALFFARINVEGEVTTGLCDPNTPWESLTEWDQELITEHIPDYCANKNAVVTPPGA